ncbi:gamma-aminobutyric acid receptor subunit beta-1-like [Penaeus chinensis]|uniref:gamma-aminobutyric acid receptor subunit beta-1-like n=1 Tax=Penaeus chinensis TaxID=139456 RepID=UPI001FB73D2E|nr:gamma-aminobutyric acid receptor subunit beta-1-like [Penaeus chinensis]
MYDGTKNLLMFQEEQTIHFGCHFDLVMYPFDQQECYLNIEIYDYDLRLGYFVKDGEGASYKGNRRLLEYNLLWTHYQPYLDHNASHAGVRVQNSKPFHFPPPSQLELRFRNQFRYYIGNIFMPSLMLVILCYVTLFFDLNDFNDRIMVSLTSLLVLVTFFTDTSNSIPKTAYFKLIDVWFMSLMFEDFFIILSIIYIEELRQDVATPTSSSGSTGTFVRVRSVSSLPAKPQPTALGRGSERIVRINRYLSRFFAFTLVLMLIIFIPMGVYGLTKNVMRPHRPTVTLLHPDTLEPIGEQDRF